MTFSRRIGEEALQPCHTDNESSHLMQHQISPLKMSTELSCSARYCPENSSSFDSRRTVPRDTLDATVSEKRLNSKENPRRGEKAITDLTLMAVIKPHGSIQNNFIECSGEMKKKRDTALLNLLEQYGEANEVFLTKREFAQMHLFNFADFIFNMKQQAFKKKPRSSYLLRITSYMLWCGFCGIILCLVAFLLFLHGLQYVEFYLPYTSHDQQSILPLHTVPSWSPTSSVYIYASLQGFQSFYISLARYNYDPSLKEVCNDTQRVQCLRALRAPETVPEIKDLAQKPPHEILSPSGIFEFLIYNDYFSLYRLEDSKEIAIDTTSIVPASEFFLYVNNDHIKCLTNSSKLCWISPFSSRFQHWMTLLFNFQDRILLGKIPQGLLAVPHKIVWTQNVWPAEQFRVEKRLQFVQMSTWGAPQKSASIVCGAIGLLILINALVMFFLYNIQCIDILTIIKSNMAVKKVTESLHFLRQFGQKTKPSDTNAKK